ncbi:Tubby-like F-box protein 3, partial [Cucurbita argyrosperma subsp. sororia]
MSLKRFFLDMRSRSRPVVQDSSAPEPRDDMEQSGWANMPSELLRDIFMRIEESEASWPLRKSVVACAGVCRSWRIISKEIVLTLEVSGRLTFPISLKQPGPRDHIVRCFIKRNSSNQTYHLFLNLTNALTEDGKFLLAAHKWKRPTYTDYDISLCAEDSSKGSDTIVGKLRSNFLGTKFTIFDKQPPHSEAKITKSTKSTKSTQGLSSRPVHLNEVSSNVPSGNYPVAHISYELNVLGSRGPRRMQCVMDAIPASAVEPGGVAPTLAELSLRNIELIPSFPFWRLNSDTDSLMSKPLDSQEDGILMLRNKTPRWHERLQCWCLNFHGRVTIASVKNFQLVASREDEQPTDDHDTIILQFGKVGKGLFTMDYRYPISAFLAFAICLSSIDTKIACE